MMKAKNLHEIKHAVGRLVLIILLLLPAVAWRGQIWGFITNGTAVEEPEMQLSVDECAYYFDNLSEIKKLNKHQFQLYNDKGELIGRALAYKGEKGYGGRVPLFILTNMEGAIEGIVLGKHYESKEYIEDVLERGLLKNWNGLKSEAAIAKEVDTYSGATLSSQAIISGVQSALSGTVVKANYKIVTIENVLSLVLLILLSFAYFYPKVMMKYRLILQIITIAVFGFWLTRFISLSLIMSWFSSGINIRFHLVTVVIFVLSILFPLLFGKSFYCTWVCPFGAAQELCGKMKASKVNISASTYRWLNYTREIFFFAVLIFLWLGFVFDLSYVEPFSAFSIRQASYFTLGLAGFFLVVSLFVPKAWCRYFCPTGYLLDWIRK